MRGCFALLATLQLAVSLHIPLSATHEVAVEIRRDLHKIPELQYDSPLTSARVQEAPTEIGVKFKAGYTKHGIVASIGTGSPCIALRADMDAFPYRSR